VIASCVLVTGLGVGIIWNRHFPYEICSVINNPNMIRSADKPRQRSEEKIFLETASISCY
jgi:hypothetical protein